MRSGTPHPAIGSMHINGARHCNGQPSPLDPSTSRAAVGQQRAGSGEDNEPVSALPVVVIVRLLRLSWRIRGRIISAVTPPMAAMLDERRLLLLTQARIELLRGGA